MLAVPGAPARRLALWHPPRGNPRGALLYAHPLAEEMNKSRRMAALAARALAAQGFGVLQIDLLGCGDSGGDFGDATWAQWIADLAAGATWLRERSGGAPLTLWGLRAGCLLAAALAQQLAQQHPGERCSFLFWQPTPSGAAVLRQFLRTAAAAAMLDGGGKGVVESLRQQLAAGQPVEVGGYVVHPELAAGLEQARLAPPSAAGSVGQVAWLELAAAGSEGAVPAHIVQAAEPWAAAAESLAVQTVAGPPFWQTAEIEVAPQLIERTARLLDPPEPAERAGGG